MRVRDRVWVRVRVWNRVRVRVRVKVKVSINLITVAHSQVLVQQRQAKAERTGALKVEIDQKGAAIEEVRDEGALKGHIHIANTISLAIE